MKRRDRERRRRAKRKAFDEAMAHELGEIRALRFSDLGLTEAEVQGLADKLAELPPTYELFNHAKRTFRKL